MEKRIFNIKKITLYIKQYLYSLKKVYERGRSKLRSINKTTTKI